MPLLASRSLWEQTGPQDVIVDLIGVSSNHGAGTVTLDIEVVATPEAGFGTLSVIRPARRPRRRPRIVFPDPEPPTAKPDVFVDLIGAGRPGVGSPEVITPFDLTEDECFLLMALLSDE